MSQSATTKQEMPTHDRAIRNMKSRTTDILRGANPYGVLEDSDEECLISKVQMSNSIMRGNKDLE